MRVQALLVALVAVLLLTSSVDAAGRLSVNYIFAAAGEITQVDALTATSAVVGSSDVERLEFGAFNDLSLTAGEGIDIETSHFDAVSNGSPLVVNAPLSDITFHAANSFNSISQQVLEFTAQQNLQISAPRGTIRTIATTSITTATRVQVVAGSGGFSVISKDGDINVSSNRSIIANGGGTVDIDGKRELELLSKGTTNLQVTGFTGTVDLDARNRMSVDGANSLTVSATSATKGDIIGRAGDAVDIGSQGSMTFVGGEKGLDITSRGDNVELSARNVASITAQNQLTLKGDVQGVYFESLGTGDIAFNAPSGKVILDATAAGDASKVTFSISSVAAINVGNPSTASKIASPTVSFDGDAGVTVGDNTTATTVVDVQGLLAFHSHYFTATPGANGATISASQGGELRVTGTNSVSHSAATITGQGNAVLVQGGTVSMASTSKTNPMTFTSSRNILLTATRTQGVGDLSLTSGTLTEIKPNTNYVLNGGEVKYVVTNGDNKLESSEDLFITTQTPHDATTFLQAVGTLELSNTDNMDDVLITTGTMGTSLTGDYSNNGPEGLQLTSNDGPTNLLAEHKVLISSTTSSVKFETIAENVVSGEQTLTITGGTTMDVKATTQDIAFTAGTQFTTDAENKVTLKATATRAAVRFVSGHDAGNDDKITASSKTDSTIEASTKNEFLVGRDGRFEANHATNAELRMDSTGAIAFSTSKSSSIRMDAKTDVTIKSLNNQFTFTADDILFKGNHTKVLAMSQTYTGGTRGMLMRSLDELDITASAKIGYTTGGDITFKFAKATTLTQQAANGNLRLRAPDAVNVTALAGHVTMSAQVHDVISNSDIYFEGGDGTGDLVSFQGTNVKIDAEHFATLDVFQGALKIKSTGDTIVHSDNGDVIFFGSDGNVRTQKVQQLATGTTSAVFGGDVSLVSNIQKVSFTSTGDVSILSHEGSIAKKVSNNQLDEILFTSAKDLIVLAKNNDASFTANKIHFSANLNDTFADGDGDITASASKAFKITTTKSHDVKFYSGGVLSIEAKNAGRPLRMTASGDVLGTAFPNGAGPAGGVVSSVSDGYTQTGTGHVGFQATNDCVDVFWDGKGVILKAENAATESSDLEVRARDSVFATAAGGFDMAANRFSEDRHADAGSTNGGVGGTSFNLPIGASVHTTDPRGNIAIVAKSGEIKQVANLDIRLESPKHVSLTGAAGVDGVSTPFTGSFIVHSEDGEAQFQGHTGLTLVSAGVLDFEASRHINVTSQDKMKIEGTSITGDAEAGNFEFVTSQKNDILFDAVNGLKALAGGSGSFYRSERDMTFTAVGALTVDGDRGVTMSTLSGPISMTAAAKPLEITVAKEANIEAGGAFVVKGTSPLLVQGANVDVHTQAGPIQMIMTATNVASQLIGGDSLILESGGGSTAATGKDRTLLRGKQVQLKATEDIFIEAGETLIWGKNTKPTYKIALGGDASSSALVWTSQGNMEMSTGKKFLVTADHIELNSRTGGTETQAQSTIQFHAVETDVANDNGLLIRSYRGPLQLKSSNDILLDAKHNNVADTPTTITLRSTNRMRFETFGADAADDLIFVHAKERVNVNAPVIQLQSATKVEVTANLGGAGVKDLAGIDISASRDIDVHAGGQLDFQTDKNILLLSDDRHEYSITGNQVDIKFDSKGNAAGNKLLFTTLGDESDIHLRTKTKVAAKSNDLGILTTTNRQLRLSATTDADGTPGTITSTATTEHVKLSVVDDLLISGHTQVQFKITNDADNLVVKGGEITSTSTGTTSFTNLAVDVIDLITPIKLNVQNRPDSGKDIEFSTQGKMDIKGKVSVVTHANDVTTLKGGVVDIKSLQQDHVTFTTTGEAAHLAIDGSVITSKTTQGDHKFIVGTEQQRASATFKAATTGPLTVVAQKESVTLLADPLGAASTGDVVISGADSNAVTVQALVGTFTMSATGTDQATGTIHLAQTEFGSPGITFENTLGIDVSSGQASMFVSGADTVDIKGTANVRLIADGPDNYDQPSIAISAPHPTAGDIPITAGANAVFESNDDVTFKSFGSASSSIEMESAAALPFLTYGNHQHAHDADHDGIDLIVRGSGSQLKVFNADTFTAQTPNTLKTGITVDSHTSTTLTTATGVTLTVGEAGANAGFLHMRAGGAHPHTVAAAQTGAQVGMKIESPKVAFTNANGLTEFRAGSTVTLNPPTGFGLSLEAGDKLNMIASDRIDIFGNLAYLAKGNTVNVASAAQIDLVGLGATNVPVTATANGISMVAGTSDDEGTSIRLDSKQTLMMNPTQTLSFVSGDEILAHAHNSFTIDATATTLDITAPRGGILIGSQRVDSTTTLTTLTATTQINLLPNDYLAHRLHRTFSAFGAAPVTKQVLTPLPPNTDCQCAGGHAGGPCKLCPMENARLVDIAQMLISVGLGN